jgi:ATP-dependent 26S proteasome regulatory subunit
MDPALLRPGRIDRKIYVGPPDRASRAQIIALSIKSSPIADDIDIDTLLDRSEGFSGAEVASICSEAAMIAIEAGDTMIRQQYLLEVLSSIKPQITPEMIAFYEDIKAKSFR